MKDTFLSMRLLSRTGVPSHLGGEFKVSADPANDVLCLKKKFDQEI